MRASSLFVLVLALAACSSAAANDRVVAQELQKVLVGFEAAFASKNLSAAASYFTSDGVFLSNAYEPFVGTSGIEQALGGLIEEGTVALDLMVISATVITDQPLLAWCEASYVKHGSSSILDTGFSSFVFAAVGENYKWEAAIISSVSNVSDTGLASSAFRSPRPTPVALPSTAAATPDAMQYAQAFFNSFQQIFNAGGSTSAALSKMLSPSITIYSTHYNPISGKTDALEFLTAGLASKGYKIVSSAVVEAGAHSTDLLLYARGVMSFYDANGSLISSNNYLALLDGTATSATPLLVSFSVVGNGLGYVG